MDETLKIDDERLRAIFSYPDLREGHYSRVMRGMVTLGVDMVESAGRTDLGNLRILGKGCVGIVVLGRRGRERVAVKILRSDANRASLDDEAANLRIANVEGVGPTLIGQAETVLVMEYIEGPFLSTWLQEPHTREEVTFVLGTLLAQCRKLDRVGLDHGELADAKRHIIVDGRGVPRIIDFETASTKRACRNVTSIANYLFFKDSTSMLTGRYLCLEKEKLMEVAREYKASPSEGAYRRLLTQLGLDEAV